MKKILVLFLILFAVQVQAAGIYTTVARGTVTQENMKISAVDGTAFVDFSAADVLTSKLGHLLKIRDSSGRAIQGFIKAAGSGETEGSDVFAGFDFTNTGIWSAVNATVIDANSFSTTSSNGRVQANLFTIGGLYKTSFSADETAGISSLTNAFSVADGGVDVYRTAIAGPIRVQNNSIATVDVTTMQSQQVLTPSATGVTIVSTKGGSTPNFALKNSSFNYNDPSGYTYEIIQVRQAVLMDSDACTNANATINLTDGSATWACAGIDDSAFQDGKHMITVSDATGKTVLGYYENAGSGDVVNTKSGSTNNWIWKDASFSTAGDYTRKIYYVGD